MLSCREITAKANMLIDGELSVRERLAVRLHLAMCVHCRRFNRHLRALVASLKRRAEGQVLPEGFVDRVITAIGSARDAPDREHPQGSPT